ncbi:hypothetical protein FA13DRAFT_512769 [Coprinellus micaceus]|uniref:Uncharacterized protein n=1 Tax=Coprinellus micaceus TaxID=71717 RepID=A0A4Y7SBN9_COPMI|nr:hypothetical protein FA13DRAFT_512769 [Coprinellus micaceus]
MDTKNLIRNHISKPGMTGSVAFSNALWTAIPPLIPAITVDGRETILDLAVNDLNMSSDTVAAVAKALVPVFRDGSSFARSTAVELLSSLYLKHRVEAPGLVVFAVPEIVALALDDKDDVGTLRSTAISLLVAILTATYQKHLHLGICLQANRTANGEVHGPAQKRESEDAGRQVTVHIVDRHARLATAPFPSHYNQLTISLSAKNHISAHHQLGDLHGQSQ